MIRGTRVVAGLMAGAATVAVLAGCGNSDSGSSSGAATSNNSASATAVKDLLLTQAELPAGYKVIGTSVGASSNPDAAAISAAAGQLTFSPSDCKTPQNAEAADPNMDVATLTAMSGTNSLVQMVGSQTGDIAKMRSMFTGKCATMTSTATGGVTTTYKFTTIDVPRGGADDVYAYKMDFSVGHSGMLNAATLNGYANVRGHLVSVSSSAPTGTPDQAAFTSTLTKAIQKVAAAS